MVKLSKKEKYSLTNEEKLIYYYRNYPVQAAEDLLNVKLIWLQRIVFRWMWFCPFLILFLGRGCGKTWIWSVFCVLYALLYPKTMIGYLVPIRDQSVPFWDYVQEICDSSYFVKDSVKLNSRKEPVSRGSSHIVIRFKNGSKIETIAIKQGDQSQKSRGRRYHVLVLDEYKDFDPVVLGEVAIPYLTVERKNLFNKLFCSTTGCYTWNHAYKKRITYELLSELGMHQYKVASFDHRDVNMVPEEESPYRMSDMMINQIRQEPDMTEEKFKMEVFCFHPDESEGMFTERLLSSNKVCPHFPNAMPIETVGEKDSEYVLGIDIATSQHGDNFVIVVIKLLPDIRGGAVVNVFAARGWDTDRITLEIFKRIRDFRVVRMYLDKTGAGVAIAKNLSEGFEEWGIPRILEVDDKNSEEIQRRHGGRMIMKAASWAVASNTFRMDLLKTNFEHGRLKLAYPIRFGDDDIVKISNEIARTKLELIMLQAEKIAGGYRYEPASGYKDDRAKSIGLANEAMQDMFYVDLIAKPESLAIGSIVRLR